MTVWEAYRVTQERFKEMQVEGAWRQVRENFDGTKPRRLIRGVAISSRRKNAHGNGYAACGLQVTGPALLLLNHDYTFPLGQVTSVDIRGDEVHFRAELCNRSNPGPFWTAEAWASILKYELCCASVGGIRVLSQSHENQKGVIARWTVDEVSLLRWVRHRCSSHQSLGTVRPRYTLMVVDSNGDWSEGA